MSIEFCIPRNAKIKKNNNPLPFSVVRIPIYLLTNAQNSIYN